MIDFILQLKSFTLNPYKKDTPDNFSVKSKLSDVYYAIVVYLILAIILLIFTTLFNKIIIHFFAIDLFKLRDSNIKNAVKAGQSLFIISLLGPLVEETLFRLWLSFTKTHVLISLVVIGLVLITKYDHMSLYILKINNALFINIGLSILSGLALFFIFRLPFFKNLPNKHFSFFYWASCIGFGIVHLVNFYPLSLKLFWAYPILILPQITMGFILGYVRVKDGFFIALLTHCLVNLPAALFYFSR